ncbi:hypothetical protein [Acholeplasma granularum]|uniref:hypothetical protein n=1 Tax=Acholeplasma granularum TaxID=264635 RepID=UPI00046F6C82|nr:hypothetical protein [Acholeplasma granularum]
MTRIKLKDKLIISIIILFMIIVNTPYLYRQLPSEIFVFMTFFVTVIIILNNIKQKIPLKIIYLIFLTSAWILYQLSYKAIGLSTANIGNYIDVIVFYLYLFWYLLYIKLLPNFTKKKIFTIYSIVIFINLISNIYLSFQHPIGSLLIDTPDGNYLKLTNIGGLSFATNIMIFSLVYFDRLIKQRGTLLINLGVYLVSIYYLLFVSQRATQMIFSLLYVALITSIFLIKKKNIMVFLITFLTVIIFATIFNSFIPPERLLLRFEDLIEFIQSGFKVEKDSTFYFRLYLIQNSLINYTSTIKNVILGTGLHYFTTWEEQVNAGLGLHSEVIDTLTVYGIIGFTLCFTIVKNYYKKILDNKSKVLFLFIVFYAIFNKIVFSIIGMSIFIVINISQSEDLNEENRT